MSNQSQNPNRRTKYDLVERTSKLGELIIIFAKNIADSTINRPLISQLIRSGTSIGANYMEADCAESKKDFNHKIGICKKEAKETTHWLRMIAIANPDKKEQCRSLWQEAHELTLIFSAIINKK
jgi:four helix bundle protein